MERLIEGCRCESIDSPKVVLRADNDGMKLLFYSERRFGIRLGRGWGRVLRQAVTYSRKSELS